MTNKEYKLCELINDMLDYISAESMDDMQRFDKEMEDIIGVENE